MSDEATAVRAEVSSVKSTRTVPSYHVFRLNGDGSYKHLSHGGPITAASRKQAMRAMADREEDKGHEGTFVAIAASEFQPRRRQVRQRIEDTFSG